MARAWSMRATARALRTAFWNTCLLHKTSCFITMSQHVAPLETMTLNSCIMAALKVLRGMREGNAEKSWQWDVPTITHFNLSAPANFRMSRNAEQSSYTHRNVNNVRSRPPLTSANTGTTLQPIWTVTLSWTMRATVSSNWSERSLLHDSIRQFGETKKDSSDSIETKLCRNVISDSVTEKSDSESSSALLCSRLAHRFQCLLLDVWVGMVRAILLIFNSVGFVFILRVAYFQIGHTDKRRQMARCFCHAVSASELQWRVGELKIASSNITVFQTETHTIFWFLIFLSSVGSSILTVRRSRTAPDRLHSWKERLNWNKFRYPSTFCFKKCDETDSFLLYLLMPSPILTFLHCSFIFLPVSFITVSFQR